MIEVYNLLKNISMTEWNDFITKCPYCDDNKMIKWEHCKGFSLKINKFGDIKCNNQNCSLFSHPKFIMYNTFDCGNHGGNGRHPNSLNVWAALGMIDLFKNLNKNERSKLFMRISSYYESDSD